MDEKKQMIEDLQAALEAALETVPNGSTHRNHISCGLLIAQRLVEIHDSLERLWQTTQATKQGQGGVVPPPRDIEMSQKSLFRKKGGGK